MNKKLITKLIVWGVFIALVATAVILLVTVVNKKEETPIFQMQGSTLIKYNGKEEEVEIPNDVEVIGKGAFEKNDKVKKVTFESGSKINAISRLAFKECRKLESIELPDSIISIGDEAFKNCVALNGVILPSHITELGYETFYGCIGLTTIQLNQGLVSIDDGVFKECTKLETISIPSSVTSIGDQVFLDCESLQTIELSNNQKYTFENKTLYYVVDGAQGFPEAKELVLSLDKDLTSISFTSDIKKIHNYAFAIQSKVKSIVVPTTVTEIENNAFIGCTNVETVTVPFIGNTLDSSSAFKSIFGNDLTKLKTINVVNGTKVIEKAFRNLSSVQTINLPTTIKSVGASAFEGCAALTTVTNLPTNLERIYSATFSGCTNLSETVLLSLINPNLKVIDEKAFAGCTKLTKLELPDNVISIGAGAYENCSGLLEASLLFIGSGYEFDVNTLPNGTKEIVKKANSFNKVATFGYIFDSTNSDSANSKVVSKLTKVEIRGSENLPQDAFKGCTNLETLVLNNNIESIGDYAFSDCRNLISITLPTNLSSLGMGALSNCSKISSVNLPVNLTELKDGTFKNCTSLSLINLTNITKLGKAVFYGNTIVNVTIDSSNTSYQVINNSIYTKDTESGTRELVFYIPSSEDEKEFVVDSNVTVIHSGAFVQCELEKLVIPSNVLEIKEGAIVNCLSLEELSVPFIGNKPENEENRNSSFSCIFGGTMTEASSFVVTVLSGTEVPNLAFLGCENVTGIKLEGGHFEKIGESAFAQCVNLKEINLSEGLLEIGEYAFLGCVSIETLNIPSTVKKLGDYALADCEMIASVNIPDALEELGVGVFRNWAALKTFNISSNHAKYSILDIEEGGKILLSKDQETLILYMPSNTVKKFVLPTTIKNIDAYAFSGAKVQEVVLGEEVQEIGTGIFSNCTRLTTVSLPSSLTTIPYSMFEKCSRLKTIVNSKDNGNLENVEVIEGRAFYYCTSLENHIITDKVKEIGESAFENCQKITEVVLPTQIDSIAKSAFKGCSKLTKVVFNENIKNVGESAFEDCRQLIDFNLCEGLEEIGEKAFANCGVSIVYLTDEEGNTVNDKDGKPVRKDIVLVIPSSVKTIGLQAFTGCNHFTKIYLPVELDDDGNIVSAPESIGSEAFGNMASTKFYSEGIKVITNEEGTESSNVYPEGWDNSMVGLQTAGIYCRDQFEVDSNGYPFTSDEDVSEEIVPTTKRDTKPGQCDYKEDLGYYFMITAALLASVLLLRKRQNN